MLNFLVFIGLLSTLSQCTELERELAFNGHKSGIYLVDNANSAHEFRNGISYMFQKINDEVTIHALFHYRQHIFAAKITKGLLQNAVQSKILSKNGANTKIDWKSFLEEELKNIENRLMKPGLFNEQVVSRTSAAIVIVDGNTVTQAQVGDSCIVSFAKDSQQCQTGLRVKESPPAKLKNKLGGKFFKNKDPTMRGDADVIDLSDVRFIVMGAAYLWFVNVDTVAQIISQNRNILNEAAREITKLIKIPEYEADNGIIVIGLNPSVTIFAPKREKNTLTSAKVKKLAPESARSKRDKNVNVANRNKQCCYNCFPN